MAKTENTETENTEIVNTENTTELAVAGDTMVIDAEDIDIKRINVVQKTSQIDYDVGSVVLDKTDLLLEKNQKCNVVVVKAAKGWREDIPFDEDVMPQIVWNRHAKESLEQESNYPIIEFAEIILLFQQPEGGDPDNFPLPIGAHNYAMGKLNVHKDAYRKTYKQLATFATFNRGLPLNSRLWTFESQVIERGKYSWFVPTLSASSEKSDDAVIEFTNNFAI